MARGLKYSHHSRTTDRRVKVPGVSMTLKKCGHYPKLSGHGPIFFRVMETLGGWPQRGQLNQKLWNGANYVHPTVLPNRCLKYPTSQL